jgi:hypothetical protein
MVSVNIFYVLKKIVDFNKSIRAINVSYLPNIHHTIYPIQFKYDLHNILLIAKDCIDGQQKTFKIETDLSINYYNELDEESNLNECIIDIGNTNYSEHVIDIRDDHNYVMYISNINTISYNNSYNMEEYVRSKNLQTLLFNYDGEYKPMHYNNTTTNTTTTTNNNTNQSPYII